MMKKNIFFFTVLIGVLSFLQPAFAEDPLAKFHASKSSSASVASTTKKAAKSSTDFDELKQKLDQLLKGQADVLARLEEIKKELYIVKIRATKR